MARQVVSKGDVLKMRSQEAKADEYLDRLLKYIPAEIVAVYILVQGIVLQMDHEAATFKPILWGVFVLFTLLTPLYLWRIQKVNKIVQLVISLFAFVVWVFALGGPFTPLGWYDPIYGEILLPIFTVIIALIVAEK